MSVVKSRLDDPKSIVVGRSKCPKCNTTLGFFDLFPVLSYLFLGGKCRYCKKSISTSYLILEIVSAILAVGVYSIYGVSAMSVMLFLSLSFLLVASITDIENHEVDVILFVLGVLSAVAYAILSKVYLPTMILGAITFAVIPFFLYLVSREKWMGLGDTFFAIWGGILVGFPLSLTTVFLAFFIGALFGIIKLLTGAKSHHIAFGPFIALSVVIALYMSSTVNFNYLNILY